MKPPLSLPRKLAFSLLAVALVLALAEGVARVLIADSREALPAAGVRGGQLETEWLPMLVEDLGTPRAEELYITDSELFWRLRPDIRLSLPNAVYGTLGDPIRWELETNADGHRGPTASSHRETLGRLILCLGDSCTFGFRVDEAATYPAQLQAYLRIHGQPGTTVLNHGVPGYSSHQGRRLLARLLDELRPDVVLIGFGANDHEADRHSDQQKALHNESLLNRLHQALNSLALVRSISGRPSTDRLPPGATATAVRVPPDEFRGNLEQMIQLSREAGAQPYLLDLAFVAPAYRKLIIQVAKDTGTTWFDGPAILREALGQLVPNGSLAHEAAAMDRFWTEQVAQYRYVYFEPSVYQQMFADPLWSRLLRYLMVEPVHPNRLGHRLIAEAIGAKLTESGPAQK